MALCPSLKFSIPNHPFHPTFSTFFCACRYDPQADRWLPGPELSSRRFALAGGALGDALYAVGGYDGQSYLTTVERLDPREGRWTAVASMATQRGGHACTVLGGELYALGGYFKSAMEVCEVYSPVANAWRPIASMPDCRAYGAAAAVGGEVYVCGGLLGDMQTHATLLQKYTPGANAWSDVELPGHANPRRSFLAACASA